MGSLWKVSFDVPFIACVIHLLSIFCLQLGFVKYYFRIWIVVFFNLIHLSPVCFVSVAGCYVFDFFQDSKRIEVRSSFRVKFSKMSLYQHYLRISV